MLSKPLVELHRSSGKKGKRYVLHSPPCLGQRITKQKAFVSVFQKTYRRTRRSHMRSPFKCSVARSASQHKSHFSQATSTSHQVRCVLIARRRAFLQHCYRWPNLSPLYSWRLKLPTGWGKVHGDGATLFYPSSGRTRTLTFFLPPPLHL